MSTQAAVFVKNQDGTYTGTEITSDGYIEVVNPRRLKCPQAYGAGWILGNYWNDEEEVEKLARGNAVHCLGRDLGDTDRYSWRQNGLDNLTFDQVKNLGYSYIYLFRNGSWSVACPWSRHYGDITLDLGSFLDYDDPERFFDHEQFWG